MTRDQYIEARWSWFAERCEPHLHEAAGRERAGAAWDADHTPLAIVLKWSLYRHLSNVFTSWSWRVPTAVRLLYAVALELDEQLPATRTGEMVCAGCSGWDEVVANATREYPSTFLFRYQLYPGRPHTGARALSVQPCSCDRLRPHTVQLHRIVETIAAMRSPLVDDWPEQWLVDIDARWQAEDRSPKAVWWAQFFAWTRGGVVGEQALADALEQLVEARQREAEKQRRVRMLKLLSEPPRRVDPWTSADARLESTDP